MIPILDIESDDLAALYIKEEKSDSQHSLHIYRLLSTWFQNQTTSRQSLTIWTSKLWIHMETFFLKKKTHCKALPFSYYSNSRHSLIKKNELLSDVFGCLSIQLLSQRDKLSNIRCAKWEYYCDTFVLTWDVVKRHLSPINQKETRKWDERLWVVFLIYWCCLIKMS